jgi:hypothetical protein
MRSWMLLSIWPVLVIALLLPSRSIAQDLTTAERREAIAEYKARIAWADTAGDAEEAARQRIMLAPLLPATQARRVLEEAALIADSARLWGDEGLRAHQGLMDLYAGQGNWRKAFEESRTVQELQTREQQRQLDLAGFSERSKLELIEARRDSLASAWRAEQEAVIAERNLLRRGVQRWQLIAAVLFVVAVVIGFLGSASARKQRRSVEARMQQLAGEVEQLRSRMAAMVPPSAPPTPVVQAVATDPVPAAPEVGEDDLLLGMFRKQAPERLQALRAARAAGDHDKVRRVVSAMRPQLFALDEPRFAPLHAAITAAGAPSEPDGWNAALDRFEQAVEDQLKR